MNESKWIALEQIISSSGDELHARKLQELYQKYKSNQFNIAFCGHFSAGKSSVINELCDHAILPSSPIPTSANIVTIRNGPAQAIVTHIKQPGAMEHATVPVAFDQLAAYCKDGEHIESITIQYPIAFLGEHTQLLDTPGIDSTDDAHQMSTESALHLADVVFYVMDYNHVQSETNLSFTKRMKDWGKPVYLIINQIDKHQEHQLTFADFRSSVRDSFLQWQADPEGILYTTLKQPQHPHNEWSKVKWLITELITHAKPLRDWSLNCSLRHIVHDHIELMAESHEADKAKLRDQLPDQDELNEQMIQRDRWLAQIKQLEEFPENSYQQWNKEMTGIVENANLTPAATRDIMHVYLSSRKPGFKLGLFGRAAQTAKEIDNRLNCFYEDFIEKVNAHLVWHLKDFIKKVIQEQGLQTSMDPSDLDMLDIHLTPGWLADQVNSGAVFSNEYTINFAKQISADVKAKLRKNGLQILGKLRVHIEQRSADEAQLLALWIAELDQQLLALHALQAIENQEQAYEADMLKGMEEANEYTSLDLPDFADFQEGTYEFNSSLHSEMERSIIKSELSPAIAPSSIDEAVHTGMKGLANQDHSQRLKQTADRLLRAADLIHDVSAMKLLDKSMREKAKRMVNNRFTISLFGAFSAGKSSFANALVGQRLLPVSPNPTTATINRIMPPTAEWPHGSVKVIMKSSLSLLDEIKYSAHVVGIPAETFKEVLQQITQFSIQSLSASAKPHLGFLKAASMGWDAAEPLLGQTVAVDLTEFAAYVADESKACFVERIDLHVDHPLTAQGILFVDTPGADSIHARHTGVAFNYIKNADAIVFVTYYNHAFSQADREFLLQLGRVKDSFELDKMFFIVNAADLAANEEEKQLVIEHVRANLLKHGIRNPRIYPISSMEALEGKLSSNLTLVEHAGMQQFEQDFVRFTLDELTMMAVHAAEQEMTRCIEVIDLRIASAKQGEEERRLKLLALDDLHQELMRQLKKQQNAYDSNEITQEIQELLYYVRQRVSFRYGELFNLAFNPSSLREDGRDIRKALKSAWNELIRNFSYDLSHEVLASTLRIESFIHMKMKQRYEQQIAMITNFFSDYRGEALPNREHETPWVDEAVEEHALDEKWLHASFKNGKHFFEGEGKTKLRNALEPIMYELIQKYTDKQQMTLLAAYQEIWRQSMDEANELLLQTVNEYVDGLHDALEMKLNVDVLELKKQQLSQLIIEN